MKKIINPNSTMRPTGLLNDLDDFASSLNEIQKNGISAFDPKPLTGNGEYELFVKSNELNAAERLLIVLCLIQYIEPELYEKLIINKNPYRLREYEDTWMVLPTGETFLKLVAASSREEKIAAHRYLESNHLFYRKSVISLGEVPEGMSPYFGVLKINPAFKDLFLYNVHRSPRFSSEFPANKLETKFEWDDLMVNPSVANKLNEVRLSLEHLQDLKKEAALLKHASDGYRCLFYGPSGTGKTLAATLLGKSLQREIYRVDLSAVISKYVGETSKNLGNLFNTAEDKNWVLFFDEGDALFGKRIDTAQAADKNAHHSNQDVAYLLQRIEGYRGLVIVNSNLPQNMDQAFSRRFEMAIKFDILNAELTKKFWLDNLPKACQLAPGFNLDSLIARYPLSPAQIKNVIIRTWLKTISRSETLILQNELELCIKDELIK